MYLHAKSRHVLRREPPLPIFNVHLLTRRKKQINPNNHGEILETDVNASKEYGINRDSSFNSLKYICIPYFFLFIGISICDGGLLQDNLLCLNSMKLMLQEFITVDKYFTLHQFNSRLISTELGYMEVKDKPTPITSETLKYRTQAGM